MFEGLKRILVIVGHYGSGKTNLALNLAPDYRERGEAVALCDLDIVNPYFRSADYATLLTQSGIELIAPAFAASNLDVPALTARLDAAIETDSRLVIDVGGDDAGAAALGRYSAAIREAGGCDMLYVVNGYRYLTRTAAEAGEVLDEIHAISRLRTTGVINCSNLAEETTAQGVAETMDFADRVAESYGVPMLAVAAGEAIAPELARMLPGRPVYPVKIYVKKPWEA